GFEGRLRVEPGGAEKHLNIRAGLAKLIRAQRGEVEHDLSPRWAGVDRPHRTLSLWKPVWIAAGGVAAAMLVTFLGFTYGLANTPGQVTGQLAASGAGPPRRRGRPAPPVIPPPQPEPAEVERIRGFLAEEIEEGIVEVFEDANTTTVRLTGS